MSKITIRKIKASDSPINIIKAFKDLWLSRDLLLVFAMRDIKARYKQTFLGFLWVIFQPLASAGILSLVFGFLLNQNSNSSSYTLFVLGGVVLWQFFARIITEGSTSISNNQVLITKVFFPRMVLPTAPVLSALFDFLVIFSLVSIYNFFNGTISYQYIICFLSLLGVTVLGLGISLFLSSLDAIFRDIRHSVPFLVNLLFFMCPVFYPLSIINEKYQFIYKLNPMVVYIETFRGAFCCIKTSVTVENLIYAFFFSFLSLLIGIFTFQKVERNMVDLI